MFRVIVAGGRGFNNYQLLKAKMDVILKNKEKVQIVSGKALGADMLGEHYAKEKGYSIKEFPAAWDDLSAPGAIIMTNSFGKEYNAKAGHDRNAKMANYAEAAVIFWNGQSKGSADMIKLAKAKGLLVRVIKY